MSRPFAPERRAEILDQVIEYLAQYGLSNLSIRKLAAALGTSTTVITYQFGSRNDLVSAALGRAREANLTFLDTYRATHSGISTGAGLIVLWDWWGADPTNLAFSRIDMEAMMIDGRVPADVREDLLLFWLRYFTAWLEADGHSNATAEIRASLTLATLSGLTIDLLSTGDASRTRSALEAFAAMIDERP
ncbi:TetR/AcrR family transcriptional regulator [Agromyces mediolanus]|uniref:TetR/AcrR family transcriptional regulator n=1 Tax=Agromyces mediolanus TaxID=41986 RepID=UPI00203C85AF|nr:TetR/AcrR family transcriptional regulator [Agromyces mediolanus]MCM3658164.1 TetR/AcrR family transcriptional regulator [Agromyces mediolanus]